MRAALQAGGDVTAMTCADVGVVSHSSRALTTINLGAWQTKTIGDGSLLVGADFCDLGGC